MNKLTALNLTNILGQFVDKDNQLSIDAAIALASLNTEASVAARSVYDTLENARKIKGININEKGEYVGAIEDSVREEYESSSRKQWEELWEPTTVLTDSVLSNIKRVFPLAIFGLLCELRKEVE